MTTSGFDDSAIAARTRDAINRLIIKTIDQARPPYQYATVKEIALDGRSCRVWFAGEGNEADPTQWQTVKIGGIVPTSVGQVVRVEGRLGDKFVADVIGAARTADVDPVNFPAPLGFTMSAGYGLVAAQWNTVPNATRYRVQFANDAAITNTVREFITLSTQAQLVDLPPGQPIHARVQAITNNNQGGAWSSVQSATPMAFPQPELSDGFAPTASPQPVVTPGLGMLVAEWLATSNPDPVTYEVHVSTASGFTPSPATLHGEIQGTFYIFNTTASGAALVYGTNYFVRLVAKDKDGKAPPGAQGFAAPRKVELGDVGNVPSGSFSDGQVPASSPNAPAITNGVGFLYATWTHPANPDQLTYEVHVSTVNNFTPSPNTKVLETTATYAFIRKQGPGAGDANLVYGVTYFVKIWAKDRDGYSANAGTQGSGFTLQVGAGDLYDNAVESAKIAANAVTQFKIADGAILEAKVNTGAISTVKLADGAVTVGKIGPLAVTAEKIDANAVNTVKLADGAVTAGKIGPLAVTTEKIDANAISTVKLADGAVTVGKIGPLAVTTEKINTSAITTVKIADNAIEAPKILAGAVIADKIAANAVTADKITANAITAVKIEANAVVADKIAANAVTTAKLDALAITADKIAANAVTAVKIDANAITSDKIAANAVTANKLSVITGGGNLLANSGFANFTPPSAPVGYGIYNNTAAAQPTTITKQPGFRSGTFAYRVAWAVANTTTKGIFATPEQQGGWSWRAGVIYTVTFMARADLTQVTTMGVMANAPSPTVTWIERPNLSTTWQRFSFRYSRPSDSNDALFLSVNNATGGTGWLELSNIQVEEGDVPTTWAPRADELLPGSILATHLSANSVTAEKVEANAITADKIAANAVTAVKIDALAITAEKIAANAVIADKIAANAVTTAKLDALAVNADKIAANAITTTKIDAGAVTAAKITAEWLVGGKLLIGGTGTNYASTNHDPTTKPNQTDINNAVAPANTRIALWQHTNTTFIDGGQIFANSVTANQIAANTITADQIAANTIGANQIAANTITAGSAIIQDLAVDTAKIANIAITTAKIRDLAVDTAKINALAVTTAKIDDLAVTDAKIQNLNAGKITATGTITAPEVILSGSPASILRSSNFAAGSTGWVIRGNGSAEFSNLAIRGTSTFSGTLSGNVGTFSGTLSGGTITGGSINIGSGVFQVATNGHVTMSSGSISGDLLSGGTITGTSFQTATSGDRLVINPTSGDRVEFFTQFGSLGTIGVHGRSDGLSIRSSRIFLHVPGTNHPPTRAPLTCGDVTALGVTGSSFQLTNGTALSVDGHTHALPSHEHPMPAHNHNSTTPNYTSLNIGGVQVINSSREWTGSSISASGGLSTSAQTVEIGRGNTPVFLKHSAGHLYIGDFSSLTSRNRDCHAGRFINSAGTVLTSDRAIKKDIRTLEKGALATVRSTPVRRYKTRENHRLGLPDGDENVGWVAQEVPEDAQVLLQEPGQAPLMGIHMETMVATLWAAFQELTDEVASLKAKK